MRRLHQAPGGRTPRLVAAVGAATLTLTLSILATAGFGGHAFWLWMYRVLF